MVTDSKVLEGQGSIAIVGFMAAGKTTVGELLAERLGMPFLDTDQQIESAFGSSVADIFLSHGESEFRSAERGLIGRLIGGEPRVLSLGGGAFADERTRRTINAGATSVWLDTPFELIMERLVRSNHRPLACGRPAGELERLWRERRHGYAQAHLRIESADLDPGEAVAQIIRALP
jgi:shikimate kinase